jgi:hypothetical protein
VYVFIPSKRAKNCEDVFDEVFGIELHSSILQKVTQYYLKKQKGKYFNSVSYNCTLSSLFNKQITNTIIKVLFTDHQRVGLEQAFAVIERAAYTYYSYTGVSPHPTCPTYSPKPLSFLHLTFSISYSLFINILLLFNRENSNSSN